MKLCSSCFEFDDLSSCMPTCILLEYEIKQNDDDASSCFFFLSLF